ncbi:MAG: peptide-methionine (S)-S-oxide reductase MsrA [Candidatus Levybacteria bacterium]|nr:peptide-methionine (S)-S-oxide reductase MsrA [Candidatus Levybacteria bacterium]
MEKQPQLATLAGGCFWCTEAIFQRIKGVLSVVSGYAGGKTENPTYEAVSSGSTGHAEAVQVTFDKTIISYEKLLDIFWHLVDPTTLNRQGADTGTQYRSAILYHSEEQKRIAIESKEKTENSGMYKNPIVTEIIPFTKFYKAEEYHQNFYNANQNYGYCSLVINPKIEKLIELYNKDVKEEYLPS